MSVQAVIGPARRSVVNNAIRIIRMFRVRAGCRWRPLVVGVGRITPSGLILEPVIIAGALVVQEPLVAGQGNRLGRQGFPRPVEERILGG